MLSFKITLRHSSLTLVGAIFNYGVVCWVIPIVFSLLLPSLLSGQRKSLQPASLRNLLLSLLNWGRRSRSDFNSLVVFRLLYFHFIHGDGVQILLHSSCLKFRFRFLLRCFRRSSWDEQHRSIHKVLNKSKVIDDSKFTYQCQAIFLVYNHHCIVYICSQSSSLLRKDFCCLIPVCLNNRIRVIFSFFL